MATWFVRHIPQHVLDVAGENTVQVVQRSSGNIAVVFEQIQCTPTKRIILNECIGGDGPFAAWFPTGDRM